MNSVETEWRRALADELGNNMLMDTPRGKTAFACGAAFVVNRLAEKCSKKELYKIYYDLHDFIENYMKET